MARRGSEPGVATDRTMPQRADAIRGRPLQNQRDTRRFFMQTRQIPDSDKNV
jgi:hypothetical protein